MMNINQVHQFLKKKSMKTKIKKMTLDQLICMKLISCNKSYGSSSNLRGNIYLVDVLFSHTK